MPNKKLTDNEIVKALECCKSDTALCNECPYDKIGECIEKLCADSIDLINRQKAEIDRISRLFLDALTTNVIRADIISEQKAENERLKEEVKEHIKKGVAKRKYDRALIKAKAYQDFAYDLKQIPREYVYKWEIDNLLKEKVGENNV